MAILLENLTIGEWSFVGEQTVSAGELSPGFENLLANTRYRLQFVGSHNTSSGTWSLRYNQNSGSNYVAAGWRINSGAGAVLAIAGVSVSATLTGAAVSTTGIGINGYVEFDTLDGNGFFSTAQEDTGGQAMGTRGIFHFNSGPVTSVQILVGSGTLTGTFKLLRFI